MRQRAEWANVSTFSCAGSRGFLFLQIAVYGQSTSDSVDRAIVKQGLWIAIEFASGEMLPSEQSFMPGSRGCAGNAARLAIGCGKGIL